MNFERRFTYPFRTLAPAGGFSAPFSILNAAAQLRQTITEGNAVGTHLFNDYLAAKLTAKYALCCANGKSALFSIFQALKKLQDNAVVGMAAYTCPDIAVAAAEAGLRVLPLETDARTLDIDYSSIRPEHYKRISAIVLSNLYGLADDLRPWKENERRCSMLIIDDACQALLSRTAEGRVGLRPGVIGVASFGRGKALCGTGGGAVLWPEERQDCSLHHEVLEHVQACSPALRGSLADCLRSALFWILENPLLYTIPANMPFLKLGGTFPEFGFRRGGISSVQLYQALAQLIDAEERAAGLRGKVKLWAEALSSLKIIHPFTERGFDFDGMISPIRYPVLFPNNEIRDHAFAAMQKAGLGVSKSYPAPLSGYEPLRQFILPNDCPQAEDVAARILTLPVHHYVRPEDIELGAKIIGNLPGVQ